jgi:hypothetical protein
MALLKPTQYSILCTSELGGETPCRIRAWSLILNKKHVFHIEKKNCHEAIATCKETPVFPVNKVEDKKRITGKNFDPRKKKSRSTCSTCGLGFGALEMGDLRLDDCSDSWSDGDGTPTSRPR